MEKEYQISWLKVGGVLALIVVIIAILCLLYPKNEKATNNTSTGYINNITSMKEAGFEYFQGNNLPDDIGESNKITLSDMIHSNLIVEFLDENGKTCNEDDSFVEVTKTFENEFSMKVSLSCSTKDDYIVTTIMDKKCPDCNNNHITQTNNQSSNVDNNSNNQNTNANNNSSSSNQKPSYTKPSYTNNVTSITNYNINYVNNCNNCSGSNCGSCTSNVYYTVSFNANGGAQVGSQTVKYGDTANYQTTTRNEYKFLGWYLDGKKYDFNTPITRRITLIAKWQKNDGNHNEYVTPKYNVCFVTNGGTKINCISVEEGLRVNRPNNPTRNCYTFAGWYTDSSLTKIYNFNNGIYQDITLYAKWQENDSCKNNYNVYFESNGGSYVYPVLNILEGSRVNKPSNPTKSCYSFVGWYTDSKLTNAYNFNNKIYDDLTLYAKWQDDGSCRELYRVAFNSNGGSYITTQNVYEGNRAYEPSEPYRSDYTFAGWYKNSSLTQKYNFNNGVYQDLTLYAKWEKDEVKYHTYCKVENERIYSTGYVGKGDIANKNNYNYGYQLRLYKSNVKDMKVTDYGNISNTEYTKAYNYLVSYNKPLDLVNNTGGGINPGSSTNLKTYSLKAINFSTRVTYNYHSGNNWYFNVNNSLYNLDNIETPKYYTGSSYYVYFVPLYFDIEYTNLSNCIADKASNSYKYNNYKVTNTYYR